MRAPFSTATDFGVNLQRNEPERVKVEREILALPVTALTTAGVTLLTVPSAAVFQVQQFAVINHTATLATFSVYIVPSGGSAGTTNVIVPSKQVAGNDTVAPEHRWMFVAPSGSSIVATASANSTLNITLSGMMVYSGDLM